MMQSGEINELSAALAKAQGAMKAATYNKINPHFKSRYADLAAVLDAIRKPLSDNGLSITQTTEIRGDSFVLVTVLRHNTGQWVVSEYPLPLNATAQQQGSALTYAKRYSLSSFVCIAADDDDDANSISNKINQEQIEEIQKLILETGGERAGDLLTGFCNKYGIKEIKDLSADQFQNAKTALAKTGIKK